MRTQTVLTLLGCHPCGLVECAGRDHLREFPQFNRGVRGVGATSDKVHAVVDSTTFTLLSTAVLGLTDGSA